MKIKDTCDEYDGIFNFKFKKLDNLKIETVEFWNPEEQVRLDVGVGWWEMRRLVPLYS